MLGDTRHHDEETDNDCEGPHHANILVPFSLQVRLFVCELKLLVLTHLDPNRRAGLRNRTQQDDPQDNQCESIEQA